jgi:hypothetical protein
VPFDITPDSRSVYRRSIVHMHSPKLEVVHKKGVAIIKLYELSGAFCILH